MAQTAVIEKMEIRESKKPSITYKWDIVWFNVFLLSSLHIGTLYGLYLALTSAKLYTTIFSLIAIPVSLFGVTAGAHRLWSHRSYKASLPLEILLMILNSMAFQGSIFAWSRDHRLHHKHVETDADPYNPQRSFFFSHIGWLLCKKHPDVINKGKGIDMEDLRQNPVIAFQQKYYFYLAALMCFIVPTAIPVYLWNETWRDAYFVAAVSRFIVSLNIALAVNSIAHRFGDRPYDKGINPADNKIMAVLAVGDGFHNYHHVFPWDYKTSEFGSYKYNLTCSFIDFFTMIGWAYDLKTVTADNVKQRALRSGGGTQNAWGWCYEDQT